jgi:hypothetical protein
MALVRVAVRTTHTFLGEGWGKTVKKRWRRGPLSLCLLYGQGWRWQPCRGGDLWWWW